MRHRTNTCPERYVTSTGKLTCPHDHDQTTEVLL